MATQLKYILNAKQALIGYLSSTISLFGIFLSTMLIHYNGMIDWQYLRYGVLVAALVSFVPAVIIKYTKISKWYFSIIVGVLLGLFVATIFVRIKAKI